MAKDWSKSPWACIVIPALGFTAVAGGLAFQASGLKSQRSQFDMTLARSADTARQAAISNLLAVGAQTKCRSGAPVGDKLWSERDMPALAAAAIAVIPMLADPADAAILEAYIATWYVFEPGGDLRDRLFEYKGKAPRYLAEELFELEFGLGVNDVSDQIRETAQEEFTGADKSLERLAMLFWKIPERSLGDAETLKVIRKTYTEEQKRAKEVPNSPPLAVANWSLDDCKIDVYKLRRALAQRVARLGALPSGDTIDAG